MDIITTIPDQLVSRVIDGMAGQNGYQAFLDEGQTEPNPESKSQFAKRMVREYIKNNVIAWEANQAVDEARDLAVEAAENEIELS